MVEDEEKDTIEVMSCWQSESGFDDHLRWRIETSRWRDIEAKYIEGEPNIKLMPVMSALLNDSSQLDKGVCWCRSSDHHSRRFKTLMPVTEG